MNTQTRIMIRSDTGIPLDYHEPYCKTFARTRLLIVTMPPVAWQWWLDWRDTPAFEDGTVSGILADWIEEHPDHFEAEPGALDAWASYLRTLLNNPVRNQVTSASA